jgi:hypothetical protein
MRKRSVRRTVILFITVPIAILAYGADVADRLGLMELSNREPFILGWGRHNDAFAEFVNSRSLASEKNRFHLLLILNVPHSDIDPMTDTHIVKSTVYTITGGIMTLAANVSVSDHLRVLVPPTKQPGDTFDVFVNYYTALIPSGISQEQIRTLSDVEPLGGRIISASATTVSFKVGHRTPEERAELDERGESCHRRCDFRKWGKANDLVMRNDYADRRGHRHSHRPPIEAGFTMW